MVINENTSANASRSLDGYKQIAAGVPAVTVPGGGAGGGSGSTPGGGSGTVPGSGSDGGSGGAIGGGAGSGSGSGGSPTGGNGAADPAVTPPSAADRTAISMATLVLAFGASLFLL
jgi:hypothetical protein